MNLLRHERPEDAVREELKALLKQRKALEEDVTHRLVLLGLYSYEPRMAFCILSELILHSFKE